MCNEASENKCATKEKGGSGLSLADQLFTSVDISKKLTPKLIKELKSFKLFSSIILFLFSFYWH